MRKNPETLILGIDLGGTKILTAVTNAQGRILSRDHSMTPAEKGQETVIKSLLESVGRALDQANIAASALSAIGMAAPYPASEICCLSRRLKKLRREHLNSLTRQYVSPVLSLDRILPWSVLLLLHSRK